MRVSVCLSVSSHISKTTCPNFTRNFPYMLTVAVARSSSIDSAIHYVLPVLWMMSCLPIVSQAKSLRTGSEIWCLQLPTIAFYALTLSAHSDCCSFAPCTNILTYLFVFHMRNLAVMRRFFWWIKVRVPALGSQRKERNVLSLSLGVQCWMKKWSGRWTVGVEM